MTEEHEEDCECAVCDTLIMRPDPNWVPIKAAPGTVGRCIFCRETRAVDHYTAFGQNVCRDCGERIR